MRNHFRSRRLFEPLSLFFPAVLAFSLLGPSPSDAQAPKPQISFVFPQGVQRGKTIEATVSGKDLTDANSVRITGGGLTASVVKVENPNTVRVSVNMAPEGELGQRDLRVITPNGASNRFRFVVGAVPELNETEPNSETSQAQQLESLPLLINGQILPADKDFFRFTAKAGQTVVCEVHARTLLPYIADAVPGWLEACLTLYDANGKQLQYVHHFRFHPDPVLLYNFQEDGEYLLEIRDLIYRGREDFIYRLTVGASPYITDVFPLGWQRNSDAQIELHGVNLPTQSMNFNLPGDYPPLYFVRLNHNGLTSNTLPFAVGDTPEARETEPNDSVEQANRVQVPVAINGRIQASGDTDHFAFTAKQGERLIMEVQARRLDSPLDSLVTLFNSAGQELLEQDDTDMGDPLLTHHADSRVDNTFPADGDYVLRVRDIQGNWGEEYAYRLLVAPPHPDYTLQIIPDNLRLEPGDTAMVTADASRKDGFDGEIKLSAQNLPQGFVASDAVIPAGQTQTRLTITAPPNAAVGLSSPSFQGIAVDDKAKAEYDAAEKAAQEAETAAANAKAAADSAAALQANAEKDAAAKRQQANAQQAYEAAEKAAQEAEATAKAISEDAGKSEEEKKQAAAEAAAKRKAADEALANVKSQVAEATKALQAAEQAAAEAEMAAATAKAEAEKARAAQAAAEKVAPEKRKLADDAKAKLGQPLVREAVPAEEVMQAFSLKHHVPTQEFLLSASAPATFALSTNIPATEVREVPQGSELAVVVKASREGIKAALGRAEAEKKAADEALAKVKGDLEKAKTDYEAAEKAAQEAETAAAPEKRKLADEAKARQDQLINDEKAANTKVDEAGKKVDAAKKDAEGPITLVADAPPGGISVTSAVIPADKDEVTITLAVAKQVGVGFRQNIIISGSTQIANQNVTRFAPAIPIRVVAAPQ